MSPGYKPGFIEWSDAATRLKSADGCPRYDVEDVIGREWSIIDPQYSTLLFRHFRYRLPNATTSSDAVEGIIRNYFRRAYYGVDHDGQSLTRVASVSDISNDILWVDVVVYMSISIVHGVDLVPTISTWLRSGFTRECLAQDFPSDSTVQFDEYLDSERGPDTAILHCPDSFVGMKRPSVKVFSGAREEALDITRLVF